MRMTNPRLPKALVDEYDRLLLERTQLLTRLGDIDKALDAVSYSVRLLDPDWVPPVKPRRRLSASRLPRGAVAHDCLMLLRQTESLWTPELVERIAKRHRLRFADRQAELDFASSVAMALRRYERKGVLHIVERQARTGALRWAMCRDTEGRMSVDSALPGKP